MNAMLSTRKTITRIVGILLALTMLFGLIACNTPDESVDTTTGNVENTQAPDNETQADSTNKVETDIFGGEQTYYQDKVQDQNLNETITILYWSDREHEEFISEETTADTVLDALYWRNQTVMSRLGVEFEYIGQIGNGDNIAPWCSFVESRIQSGDSGFDMMGGYSMSVASCAIKGFCYNLLEDDCDALSFNESPWWPVGLTDQASVNDILYFCSGDISANVLYMMYTCFFNDNIIQEYGITEDPHACVQNDTWTLETFVNMCQGVYSDEDGDGTKSEGDRFGYMTSGIHVDPWLYCDGTMIMENVGDEFQLSEKFVSGEGIIHVAQTLNSLLWNSTYGMYTSKVKHQNAFNEGRLLFCMDRARCAITRFNSEDIFTKVVPSPKMNAEVENYYTVVGNPFTLYAIPSDHKDAGTVAIVMEVMASESYRQIVPALFEVTFKTKKVDDPISSEMYDIIRENIVFDMGRLYNDILATQGMGRSQISGNEISWAGLMSAQKRSINKKISTLIMPAFEG